MSPTDGSVLNLGSLPSDVIRKIITINPRWNTLAREHLEDRNRYPALGKCFSICDSFTKQTSICIEYPTALMNYFGMMYKSFYLVGGTFASEYRRYEFRFYNDQPMSDGKDMHFLKNVFGRSSSVKVFGIHFPAFGLGKHIKNIKCATGPLKIGEMRISGTYGDAKEETSEIVNYVNYNKVRLLSLETYRIEFVKTSGNFFTEITSFVTTIKFERKEVANYPEELERHRRVWQEATDWLNETGKITAKLTVEPIDAKQYESNLKMCITMERKGDN